MRKGTHIVAVLGLLALGLMISGCGGGSGSATGASPLTKARFLKQADAICASAEKTKNAILTKAFKQQQAKGSSGSGKKAQEQLVVSVLTPLERMTEELGSLPAPAGDEDEVAKIVSSFETSLNELGQNPSSALVPGSQPFEKADKLAGKYGLHACAEV